MATLLWLALIQDDVVLIPRKDRNAYEPAVKACAEAEALIEKDPKAAIAKLDDVLRLKLAHVERRLKLAESDGGWTDEVRFFPYQYRGRARMALAKIRKEEAETLLAGAVEDLGKSVALKAASGGYLREAEEALKKARRKDARAEWRALVEARKFKSARALLESGAIGDAGKLLAETEAACRAHVLASLADFGAGPRFSEAAKIDFSRRFLLPDPAELIGEHPILDWCRAQLDVLRRLREEGLDPVLERQMLDARKLAAAEENRWFRVTAALAHDYIESRLRSLLDHVSRAPLAERRRLRAAGGRLHAGWAETCEKAGRDYRENCPELRNPLLATLAASFPVDPEELDSIDLDGCFAADSPEAFLDGAIAKLRELRKTPRISEESLRKTLTLLVAATAIRELLAGRSEAEVVESLNEVGTELRKLGGAAETRRWGPRVDRVFAALLRNP
ncbi:MAG: hypothetical protein HYY17_00335 [Planctomycetes bacterium]|nr:hypothetical protein [Planctomycetota bacterium]